MEWYLAVFRKYADFNGRARRKEYWMFVLCNVVITFVLGIFTRLVPFLAFLTGLYGLALIVPSLAVSWRRLHDVGKSGAWYFISLIPLVGAILLLIQLAKEGDAGENAYGPDPKASENTMG